jgi:hypothetical protein
MPAAQVPLKSLALLSPDIALDGSASTEVW